MLLVAGAAYHAAPFLPYVWDDDVLIAGLGGLEASLGTRLSAAWSPFLDVYFRPIPLSLLAVELGAGRFAPLLSHAVNLGAFVLACLALMSWLRAEQLSDHAAGLTAVLVASLPVASEAVLWTSARGDLLVVCCAGLLLALTAKRFPIRLGRSSPRPDDHGGGVAGLVLLLLLALLSKESGIAVALAVGVRALWPTFIGQGRPGGRTIWWVVPALLVGAFLLLRWAVLPELPPPEMLEPEGADRVLLSLATVAAQTSRVFWPWLPDLSVGLRAVPPAGDLAPWLGLAVLSVAGGLAVMAKRLGAPRVALASILFLLFLAPTSNV
ncbi:MAG: hypothetical protein VX498_11085, partial [Myxococcota bacterium]|nr:hypothetical protein [Myxococcota bacterium]